MFGIEIIDASLLPALIVALFAGLISFLSPCVLPIVPAYLAYMSGVALNDLENKKSRQKIVFTALFFVLGLSPQSGLKISSIPISIGSPS